MKIIALNTSEKKGVQKNSVQKVTLIENHGILGDAHAGNWHRQVSFLGQECITDFNNKGALVKPGAFGENIIVDEVDFTTLPIGTKVLCNECELEITQIGKECHTRCHIFTKMGDCIMPKNGVFAIVNVGGEIQVGDHVKVILP